MRAYVVKTYIKAAEGKRSGIADDFPLLPLYGNKELLFQLQGALLQGGYAAKDQGSYTLFRATDDIPSSDIGDPPCD